MTVAAEAAAAAAAAAFSLSLSLSFFLAAEGRRREEYLLPFPTLAGEGTRQVTTAEGRTGCQYMEGDVGEGKK